MPDELPRLMLAAPASGNGKTTLAIALLGAFLERGLQPAAFKCGPDYIDPMFHRAVLGLPGRNLDLFFTPPETARHLLRRGSENCDLAVMEGVMGYYDGAGATANGSSWDLAAATSTPAIMVLRPRGAFLSVAALVEGFLRFRENHMIRGLILNACTESLHERLAPVLERETGLRVYGFMPDLPGAELASRHLGLVAPNAVQRLREKTRLLAIQADETIDIGGLLALARSAPPVADEPPALRPVHSRPRIAVARDEAFCFYYQENLELLADLGAELSFFSPLVDMALPGDVDGLYLGGGYPELYAGRLAENTGMRASIKAAVEAGLPTLAECGGFLYLQRELEDADGRSHPMAGALPGVGRKTGRLGNRFGYLQLRAHEDNMLCAAGEIIRAHEFHHWDSTYRGTGFTAAKADGSGSWSCIVAGPTLYAGFPHLYFWSDPAIAEHFIDAATTRSRR